MISELKTCKPRLTPDARDKQEEMSDEGTDSLPMGASASPTFPEASSLRLSPSGGNTNSNPDYNFAPSNAARTVGR